MTEAMQGILAEAKKNKYSTIKDSLSEDDVASVWENVSGFIEKQMSQQKGVNIHGLGIFTFTQKKLDIGNNKFILIQRPIFMLSEKFAQTHALHCTKYHVPGQIPVVQLNYAALSYESPYDRDTTENCVKEILGAVARAVGAKKNVELSFSGIGRLSVRDSKVKMRFYKEFITQMDGTGKLMDSMQNRPGTVDSVMSERSPSRPPTGGTIILPKVSSTSLNAGGGLAPVNEEEEDGQAVPPQTQILAEPYLSQCHDEEDEPVNPVPTYPGYEIERQEGLEGLDIGDVDTMAAINNIENTGETTMPADMPTVNVPIPIESDRKPEVTGVRFLPEINENQQRNVPPSRSGSRISIPMAQAQGFSLLDDLVPSAQTPKSAPSPQVVYRSSPSPAERPKPLSPKLEPLSRSHSVDILRPREPQAPTPPASACGHPNAGQELCYLCHQRSRRNIPVNFTEERKRREEEEDRLLQQYQYMKDAEDTLKDQEMHFGKRHDLQKMAAFNLGVAEAVTHKKRSRDTEFHRSYIFQRRPLTPPRFYKQQDYSKDLSRQVDSKENARAKRKDDEDFLERLEQVQLAEDLAAQREQYLREKAEQQDMYQRALETQLRFKPLQLPPRESDTEVFGKNDMTNEKMADRRRRAYDLFREQQDLVAQKKREAILKRLTDQKEEEDVLDRTKRELQDDRADRYLRRADVRKRLEDDWYKAAEVKRGRELEDRVRALSPGVLLHEQCDKYSRCAQCKRKMRNCGESNIWSESRYIPGSRLMV